MAAVFRSTDFTSLFRERTRKVNRGIASGERATHTEFSTQDGWPRSQGLEPRKLCAACRTTEVVPFQNELGFVVSHPCRQKQERRKDGAPVHFGLGRVGMPAEVRSGNDSLCPNSRIILYYSCCICFGSPCSGPEGPCALRKDNLQLWYQELVENLTRTRKLVLRG